VTIDASVIGAMLDRLRAVDGFEQAQLAGDARPITGGFWATLLLVPLAGARAPAVVLRLMPDGPMAEKETIFQQQAARQGLPVPEVFVAGDGNAGLGLPFLVMARRRSPRAAHREPSWRAGGRSGRAG
jgi:hypothetical protein